LINKAPIGAVFVRYRPDPLFDLHNRTLGNLRKNMLSKTAQCLMLIVTLFCFGSYSQDQLRTSLVTATEQYDTLTVGNKGSLPSFFDGRLNWKLPLLSISGRGSLGFSPTLRVRSSDWRVESYYVDGGGYGEYYQEELNDGEFDVGQNVPKPGYGPGTLAFKREIMGQEEFSYRKTLTRIYFYGPDGGRVELIDSTFKGSPIVFSESGLRGTNYISRDGSFMTFISDTYVRDFYRGPNGAVYAPTEVYPSGYLRFANGVSYRIDNGVVTSIRERNGNYMSLSYYPGTSVGSYTVPGLLQSIVDSNGRKVDFEYDVQDVSPYGLCDRIIYKGYGGQTRVIRISKRPLSEVLSASQTIKTVSQLFPDFEGSAGNCVANQACVIRILLQVGGDYNPIRVSKIWFPNNIGYSFKYNSYGELARIDNPAGGAVEQDYIGVGSNPNTGLTLRNPWEAMGGSYIHRRASQSRTFKSGVMEAVSTFSINQEGSNTATTVQTSNPYTLAKLSIRKHYFDGYFDPGYFDANVSDMARLYPDWRRGKQTKIEELNAAYEVQKREMYDFERGNFYLWNDGSTLEADPRVREIISSDVPGNLVSKRIYSFGQFNNVTDAYEYDFGTSQAGPLVKRTHVDYVTSPYYVDSLHLRKLPLQTWVSSDLGGNSRLTWSVFEYDNYGEFPLVDRTNVFGHDTANFGTGNPTRGNLTKTTTYENAQGQAGPITTKVQYDILGNVVRNVDARGFSSFLDYTDRFGFPDGEARANAQPVELNGQSSYGFPTRATSSLGYDAYSQIDFWTGLNVNTEDINGVISKSFYNDPLDRLKQRVSAVGISGKEIQTTMSYDDHNRIVEVKSDLFETGDNLSRIETYSDSFGRVTQTRKYEAGGYIATDTEYDELGRTKKISNPYRPWQSEVPVWTETFYDLLSRVIKTKAQDQSETTVEYSGTSVTVTDPSLRKRRSVLGVQGIVRVDEPNAQGQLDNGGIPVQSTHYKYNAVGNLVEITQGGQKRYFLYDSLGRLIRSRQPEQGLNPALALYDPITGIDQWSSARTYDPNGNTLTITDARGVVITRGTYDAANRPTGTVYSDGTPAESFTYDDPLVPFSRTKLTKVANSNTSGEYTQTEYTEFDQLGRLMFSRQTTDGQQFTMGYKYNLRGDVTEQTYPSGRVVEASLDNNGNLSLVKSKQNAPSSFETYASQFSYSPGGNIASLQLGNGLFEYTKHNSRLQVYEIGVGSSLSVPNVWKVNYSFGLNANNGNITGQTINAAGTEFSQLYLYDSLNRLNEAKENYNNLETWKQTFEYDRFGNRIQRSQVIEGAQLPINNFSLPQVDASNRFATSEGYSYDPNGNLVGDPSNRQFFYDANNRQKEVKNANNQTIGKYYYNAEGFRVKKIANSETVIFVYNAVNQLIAEYSTLSTPSASPQRSYLTHDTLGTPRVKTNNSGQVRSRNDYLPFGEALSTSYRNQTGYGVQDQIRQEFTGYERDSESELDYAKARYYNKGHGRFTGVDPVGPDLTDPQSLNRYGYCFNNPLKCVDKSGGYGFEIHFMLTVALSYAAGFNYLDSVSIGLATELVDYDIDKQPMHGCNSQGRDCLGIERREKYHFTTSKQRARLWQEFEGTAAASLAGNRRVFEDLGDYLHAQMDSYSHENIGAGAGQFPLGFKSSPMSPMTPTYSRDKAEMPDRVSTDPAKALRMAEDIFGRLLVAREVMERHSSRGGPGSWDRTHAPLTFNDIKAAVGTFLNKIGDGKNDEKNQNAFNELVIEIMRIQNEVEARSNSGYR
jgi:RHS repeat-associated protein